MKNVQVGVRLLAALVVVGLGWSCGGDDGDGGPVAESGTETIETTSLRLYFSRSDGRLQGEERELPRVEDPTKRATATVVALLDGPQAAHLEPLLPAGTEVGGIYLDEAGVAFVNLFSAGSENPPAMGSKAEMLAVFGLVNSVCLNTPEVRRVVLLWNGRQRDTFAGHVDTSRPLAPLLDLVADTE